MDAGALLDLLGNENRRRILRLLSRKPCYVTEISEHLDVSPKAVIDHLRRLEAAGLVESRVDDQRRKYFHISQNLRLEVTLAPYGFGTKCAYPASPNLDLSSCQHLSLEVSRERVELSNGGVSQTGTQPHPAAGEIAALASHLDELGELSRELSLAQRWVQGRIAGALEHLSGSVDGEYLDAEILAAIAGGATELEEIGDEVDVPPPVVRDRLDRLEAAGILDRAGGRWQLA